MMDYQTQAALFQMLSHPIRLHILDELRGREACVCHLQEVTGRPQAYISQQLRTLREAGLVRDEKDGQNVYYHLIDTTVRQLLRDSFGEAGAPIKLLNCSCPFCTGELAK